MLRVAIVLESGRLRRELEALFRNGERFRLTASVTSFAQLEATDASLADVVVVDDSAVSLEGARRAHGAGVAIVVLTDNVELAISLRGLHSAVGLLPTTATAEEIAAAIEAVSADLIVIHPALDEAPSRTLEEGLLQSLTPRELEVLRELAAGHGNKSIAGRLHISEHTVKFHVAQILAKLDASSRAEAVSIGMRRGLLPV